MVITSSSCDDHNDDDDGDDVDDDNDDDADGGNDGSMSISSKKGEITTWLLTESVRDYDDYDCQ